MKIWTDKTLAVANLQPVSRAAPLRKTENSSDSVDLSEVSRYLEISNRPVDPERIVALRNDIAQIDSARIADALISRAFEMEGEGAE